MISSRGISRVLLSANTSVIPLPDSAAMRPVSTVPDLVSMMCSMYSGATSRLGSMTLVKMRSVSQLSTTARFGAPGR